MKRLVLAVSLILYICTLCSCSEGLGDTYFVHSIGFENAKDGVSITALLEKHGKDNNDYFTATSSASSLKKAAEKIMSEYKECYFATCDVYFISLDANQDTISAAAKGICDSNIFPTTGEIFCVSSAPVKDFLGTIKNSDSIRKIKEDGTENRVNIVSFFAKYSGDKSVTLDAFSLSNDKISKSGKATFSRSRKAELHESKKR